ncbi:HIT-like domain,Cwf19-like protein, C-terminal domain-2,Cwf19-like, C-terminal domain-1 [Cinara cedri]|uniref:HIT-like domain,Cwf19-like protein, C-terminal domain-2,Cwf19-like, C-terminal domain-1 n=1 Tax=Cinara cedri TaxID=506608 RepID=A0A5E4MKY4_9HEMI|nr:HIT-like domain,Cwf19-like protein, C-terminal domain-2,Cwf19-like, C-terminal domain-1 [Cinara cedri]
MANDETIRILVCSGLKGQITSFVKYLNDLFVKRGSFNYVFCIGDFFGDEESYENEWKQFLKSGTTVPVPIYTLGPNKKEHEKYFENLVDQMLAPNIYYLGKHGMFTTSEGFNIGYISGIQGPYQGVECDMHTFNYESLEEFRESFVRSRKKLDVLLTSPWPKDIEKNDLFSAKPSKECSDTKCVSNLLSWMAINLTPSYHFSGMQGIYYERSLFRNPNRQVTRFIALGDYYGPNKPDKLTRTKQKWIYGFILRKSDDLSRSDIPQVTRPPYSPEFDYCVQPISRQFFYDISAGNSRNINSHKRLKSNEELQQTNKINLDDCWFCLGSNKVVKHMIVSVGDQAYLAGTVGPLIKENLLIATVGHYQSLVHLPKKADFEVHALKYSLNKYFQSTGRGPIYYERNIMSVHFNLQVIPVPNSMVDRIEQAFLAKFKECGLKFVLVPKNALLHQIIRSKGYFYLELPNKKCYLYNIEADDKTRFPLQLAREVLASKSLLDVEDRIDWRKCKQTPEEEINDINTFRSAFKTFNRLKEKDIAH